MLTWTQLAKNVREHALLTRVFEIKKRIRRINMKINKDMTIEEIINVDEGIAAILMGSGMHCLGCVMASGENLEQACSVHGINCDALVDEINNYLAAK